MGANYASNQHNVGMAFKITDTNGTPLTLANLSSKFDVKLAITLGDDATSRGTVLEGAISPSQDANG
jgi:LEA14-like dessication related protein